jgi:hypothetical protein
MEQYFLENPWLIWVILLWVLPWKGVALWKAARQESKVWFIVFLLINTLAILEILYIFIFSQKKKGFFKNLVGKIKK